MLSMHTSWTRPLLLAVVAIWPQSILAATPRNPRSHTQAQLDDVSAAIGEARSASISAPDAQDIQHGYIGIVLPRQALNVTAERQLHLKAVHVDLGDRLDPKDPDALIAELDTSLIRRDRDIAAAALEVATSQVDLAEAKADAAWELYEIIERLWKDDRASKWEVRESELQLAVADAEVMQANAAVVQQVARIEQLNHELDSGAIRAPSEEDATWFYVVAARYCGPGDLVGPGIPIVRLISEESFVRFAVEPVDAAQLKKGDMVQVDVPDLSRTLSARIERIAPEVDAASGRVVVEAGFAESKSSTAPAADAVRAVKAGMVVRARLRHQDPSTGAELPHTD